MGLSNPHALSYPNWIPISRNIILHLIRPNSRKFSVACEIEPSLTKKRRAFLPERLSLK